MSTENRTYIVVDLDGTLTIDEPHLPYPERRLNQAVARRLDHTPREGPQTGALGSAAVNIIPAANAAGEEPPLIPSQGDLPECGAEIYPPPPNLKKFSGKVPRAFFSDP